MVRSADAALVFTLPWGTEGDKVEDGDRSGFAVAVPAVTQAFFVLMYGARAHLCAGAPDSSEKEGMIASPLIGWEGALHLGGSDGDGA